MIAPIWFALFPAPSTTSVVPVLCARQLSPEQNEHLHDAKKPAVGHHITFWFHLAKLASDHILGLRALLFASHSALHQSAAHASYSPGHYPAPAGSELQWVIESCCTRAPLKSAMRPCMLVKGEQKRFGFMMAGNCTKQRAGEQLMPVQKQSQVVDV